jgi:hypothetical protein
MNTNVNSEMNDEPDEATELLEKDKYIQMIMKI